jgi:hypothetical protein
LPKRRGETPVTARFARRGYDLPVRRPPPSPLRLPLVAAGCVALGACGTVRGGLPFWSPGEAETIVPLAPGPVAFWTEFSASYRGDMWASYDVELSQRGEVVGRATCDPVHPLRVCLNRYNGIENHSWSCKMSCSVYLPRGGPTRVQARFAVAGGPPNFRVNEAHLMIRQ